MLSQLLLDFAHAPLLQGGWTIALEALASMTHSARAQVLGIGGAKVIPFNYVTNVADPRHLDEFVEIGGGDPRVNWRVAATGAPLQIVTEDDCAELRRQPRFDLYNDFGRRWDMLYGCQIVLSQGADGLLGLATLRTEQDGVSSADDRQLLSDVAPAVLRAVRMQQGLHHQGAQLVAGTLETMSACAWLLDGRGGVVAMTTQAEREVTRQDILALRGERLRALDQSSDRRLREAIARQLASGGWRAARRFWLASTEEGANGVVAELYSLPPQDWTFGAAAAAVLVLRRGDEPRDDAQRLLAEALGLSPAEAQVALMIASGLRRGEVAKQRGVRAETVNDQLKSIFRKAHVRREADLVALVRQLTN